MPISNEHSCECSEIGYAIVMDYSFIVPQHTEQIVIRDIFQQLFTMYIHNKLFLRANARLHGASLLKLINHKLAA
jgi:hypothetical protein